MRVNREELINDLEMVKAGVSPREFIEQSSCFVFSEGHVMTFNDEVACRKKTMIQVRGAVQAATLVAILEKMNDPELKVKENEKGELEFQGKRKAFGVTMDAEIFLPIDRVEIPERWRTLPAEFTEAVDLVQHCVSADESKFVLTCVHLHPDFVESCDNLQAIRVKVATGLKRSCLIRGTSLQHIASLAMDELAVSPSWVHFRNKAGLIFSCRRYSEDYPNLDKIFIVKGHSITVPKGLAEASDRAAIFATDKAGDPLVSVFLGAGEIRLVGEGITGWYKEIKKIAYDGPSMEFSISPTLLKHISENYSDAKISPDKLRVEGGSWQYVTVLGNNKRKKKEETVKKGKEEE